MVPTTLRNGGFIFMDNLLQRLNLDIAMVTVLLPYKASTITTVISMITVVSWASSYVSLKHEHEL